MGLCQGRNCQRQVAAMIARHHGRPLADAACRHAAAAGTAGADRGDRRRVARGRGLLRCQVSAPSPAGGWLAAGELRKPLPASTDVLIVGGGLAGTALAYYLARAGVECRARRTRRAEPRGLRHERRSFHFQIAIHQLTALETGNVRHRLRDRGAAARRGGRGRGRRSSASSPGRSRSTSPAA